MILHGGRHCNWFKSGNGDEETSAVYQRKHYSIVATAYKDWQSASLDNQKSAAVIDSILETYSREFIGHKLSTPERKELGFWLTLYQLEEVIEVSIELKENPLQSEIIPLYQALIEQNLAITSKALRKNLALPREFYATRPGDYGDDLDK